MAKKNKDNVKELIDTDEDFIYCPRLGNSLKKLMDKNPDGVDDERIAKVLLLEEEEVEGIFASAIKKIRKSMGID